MLVEAAGVRGAARGRVDRAGREEHAALLLAADTRAAARPGKALPYGASRTESISDLDGVLSVSGEGYEEIARLTQRIHSRFDSLIE